jgi:hypothetical protein
MLKKNNLLRRVKSIYLSKNHIYIYTFISFYNNDIIILLIVLHQCFTNIYLSISFKYKLLSSYLKKIQDIFVQIIINDNTSYLL